MGRFRQVVSTISALQVDRPTAQSTASAGFVPPASGSPGRCVATPFGPSCEDGDAALALTIDRGGAVLANAPSSTGTRVVGLDLEAGARCGGLVSGLRPGDSA